MSAPITFTQIATHGASPAIVPNQNGSMVVDVRPGGFMRSWSQPNKIMATFAPAMATTAVTSVMPLYDAINSTIRVALTEYSTHRNRLMPRPRSFS